ncbi:hypothetical protein [Aminicella lysinilytica]|uniref:Uncharacterized protein n=1 Tax=Aminicella lysinilytica TaxID=433323 RepID=A0A4V6PUW8_9FIRM|nr:hypothetical protein [Aminicella lysinilytica]NLD11113.1 hypothetical protein [Clostridiales bacterium]TDP52992.1 hypothetical protein EV211_12410 [Aminicella lysinilytica]
MSEKPEIYFIIDGKKINREDVTLAERERAVIAIQLSADIMAGMPKSM